MTTEKSFASSIYVPTASHTSKILSGSKMGSDGTGTGRETMEDVLILLSTIRFGKCGFSGRKRTLYFDGL